MLRERLDRLAAWRERHTSSLRQLAFGTDALAAGRHAPIVDAVTGKCVFCRLLPGHPRHGAAGRATAAALRKTDGLGPERAGWR